MSNTVIESYIDHVVDERGVDRGIVRAVLRDFIEALHEADFKSSYFPSEGSVMAQVYFALGPEAAYHLVGLFARQGKGHDPDEVQTELQLLDQHAYRYSTTVQRWTAEAEVDLANQE